MKLAVSNLAWSPEEDDAVVEILLRLHVTAVELAPTKNWPLLETVSESEAKIVKDKWTQQGLEICALQSLLFGKPNLQLFVDQDNRNETLKFLKNTVDIAHWLGAKALVFGSPKNRVRGQLSYEAAFDIAVPFFREIGDYAGDRGCSFCIEPNPPVYGCDFVQTSSEGVELVKAVSSPGFGLHLDSAGMYLMNENIPDAIGNSAPHLRHFHLSAPNLDGVNESSPVDYSLFSRALENVGYTGYQSIEMKPAGDGRNVSSVERTLQYLRN